LLDRGSVCVSRRRQGLRSVPRLAARGRIVGVGRPLLIHGGWVRGVGRRVRCLVYAAYSAGYADLFEMRMPDPRQRRVRAGGGAQAAVSSAY
jgi:hypothetical protein